MPQRPAGGCRDVSDQRVDVKIGPEYPHLLSTMQSGAQLQNWVLLQELATASPTIDEMPVVKPLTCVQGSSGAGLRRVISQQHADLDCSVPKTPMSV